MTIKKAAILVSFLVLLTSTQIQARTAASLDNFDRSAGMDRPEITLAQNSLEFNEKIRRLEQERDEKRREFDEEVKASRALASKPGARIGMTAKQVREKTSWGEPEKINTTTTERQVTEQWVYDSGQYLYFRNGRLYAIQN